MSIQFGVIGQGTAVSAKKAAAPSTDDSTMAQIQGLQKQLGDLEKQLKEMQAASNGVSTPAEIELAKEIAAIEQEIKQLQQAALQQKAAQDASKDAQVSQIGKTSQTQAQQKAGVDYKPQFDYKAELGFRGVDGVVKITPPAGADGAAPSSSVGDPTATVGSVIDTQA